MRRAVGTSPLAMVRGCAPYARCAGLLADANTPGIAMYSDCDALIRDWMFAGLSVGVAHGY